MKLRFAPHLDKVISYGSRLVFTIPRDKPVGSFTDALSRHISTRPFVKPTFHYVWFSTPTHYVFVLGGDRMATKTFREFLPDAERLGHISSYEVVTAGTTARAVRNQLDTYLVQHVAHSEPGVRRWSATRS